ncbi:MAG: hypothetical protein DDT26_00116 [Dehalococcoidia bacterium]|nr:hypothetical protein [Chloroflexota bacterium]
MKILTKRLQRKQLGELLLAVSVRRTSEKISLCVGRELLETERQLRELRVRGFVVSDGYSQWRLTEHGVDLLCRCGLQHLIPSKQNFKPFTTGSNMSEIVLKECRPATARLILRIVDTLKNESNLSKIAKQLNITPSHLTLWLRKLRGHGYVGSRGSVLIEWCLMPRGDTELRQLLERQMYRRALIDFN